MAQIGLQGNNELGSAARRRLAAAGLCLVVPLAAAGWLRPDEKGFGTHRQLGLPPCTFLWLFGVRCPSCGMTTSWSHAVRGQWRRAVECNAGGALLAALDMIAAPWLLASAGRGRWLGGRPSERVLAALAACAVAVTLLDWIYRLSSQG